MSAAISPPDHKENMDGADENRVENAKHEPGTDRMPDHERKALTRRILLKLDFRYEMRVWQYILGDRH
jgi:hypothetical protein